MKKQMPNIKKLDHILYIGAGEGEDLKELISGLAAKNWLLVEGDERKLKRLKQAIAKLNAQKYSFNVKSAVVSNDGEARTWYDYNLDEFSGITKAIALKQLFPGLKLQNAKSVNTIAIDELLSEVTAESSSCGLIIKVPGLGCELLERLSEKNLLDRITFIAITTNSLDLFENPNELREVQKVVAEAGFKLTFQEVDDPDFPVLYFDRDENAERLKRLLQELAQANEAKQKNADWAQNLKSQKETLEQKLEESEKQLKQAQNRAQRFKNENDELQKKLEAAEKYNEQLAKLNERMDYMFEQQRLQLEQATNALGRHITQTSSQQVTELKARLSLERTFGTNLINLNENDSNLSEVTAVTLTQQLEDNSYDLIIEFGAGKSTEFLVNAIINNHSPNRQLENKSAANDFDASDFDLPQHVLSFEHDKKQFNAVKKRIEQNNLQNLVDLKYTPLIPNKQSQELFHDCDRALANVASLFDGRDAKVLIVVNPTNAKKQPTHAAALATVLTSLSALQLDIMLSDQLNSNELATNWQGLLTERGLESEAKQANGAYLLRINP
jgi:hypothetical protein